VSLIERLFGRTPRERRTIGVADARRLLDDGAMLIDVRSQAEWRAGHAPSAVHIPLEQLGSRMRRLPDTTRIVTACRVGGRSAQAASMLRSAGYSVANLRGGMLAWQRAGERVVAGNGKAGTIA
jgi:rhodanese-related sulfurtransferase